MKDFSVVIPVRGNIHGLLVTLGAFELFTADKSKIEVLLIADNDDPDLYEYNSLVFDYPFDIQVCPVARSDNFCRDYYTYGALKSSGKNVIMFNDDAYIQTNKWDDIIRAKTEGKEYYLVDIWDSTHEYEGHSYPRFPMISRKAIDLLGFFFYPQVRMYPADMIIWQVYNHAGVVIPCHEVKIQHDHVPNADPTKSRLMQILREDKENGVFPVRIQPEIDKLKGAINAEVKRGNTDSNGGSEQTTTVCPDSGDQEVQQSSVGKD